MGAANFSVASVSLEVYFFITESNTRLSATVDEISNSFFFVDLFLQCAATHLTLRQPAA